MLIQRIFFALLAFISFLMVIAGFLSHSGWGDSRGGTTEDLVVSLFFGILCIFFLVTTRRLGSKTKPNKK